MFRPVGRVTFFCFAKRKLTKEKASQRPCPFGVPCATRAARGRAQTRFAQTAPALIRSPLRCSARPMAWGVRVCSFAALTLHTLAVTLRAARALLPQPHQSQCALTTTATFTNLRKQTHTATCRTNTPIQPKKTKLGIPAPLHPGGGEGAGGKRGGGKRGQKAKILLETKNN